MSREIKFRAFDAVNQAMVYNVNINDGKPVMPGYQWFSPQNTIHDATPMQYTGLKDKNGVEIYEGDIVRITNDEGDAPSVHKVEYQGEQDYPAFELEPDIGCDSNCLSYAKAACQIEVIGNIYENPNLLEDGESA